MVSNLSRLSPLPFSLCGLLLAFPPFFQQPCWTLSSLSKLPTDLPTYWPTCISNSSFLSPSPSLFPIITFKCPYLSQLKTKFSLNSTTFLVSPSSPSKPLPRVIYMYFPCTETSALATPPNLLSNVVNKLFVAKFGVHLFRHWLTWPFCTMSPHFLHLASVAYHSLVFLLSLTVFLTFPLGCSFSTCPINAGIFQGSLVFSLTLSTKGFHPLLWLQLWCIFWKRDNLRLSLPQIAQGW